MSRRAIGPRWCCHPGPQRDDRIDVLLPGDEPSEVLASAEEAAAKLIEERETIRLTRKEQIAFVTALLNPSAPSARLRKAAARYRTRPRRFEA